MKYKQSQNVNKKTVNKPTEQSRHIDAENRAVVTIVEGSGGIKKW